MNNDRVITFLIIILALWLVTEYANRRMNGYSCPACGARDQKSHRKDCPWR